MTLTTSLAQTPDHSIPASLIEQLKRYVELEKERRRLEQLLGGVRESIDALMPVMTESFAANGLDNMRLDGLTIYKRAVRYVTKRTGISTQEVCERLERAGLGYMVAPAYNANSLKSCILERLDNDQTIPPEIEEVLNIGSMVSLSTRQ